MDMAAAGAVAAPAVAGAAAAAPAAAAPAAAARALKRLPCEVAGCGKVLAGIRSWRRHMVSQHDFHAPMVKQPAHALRTGAWHASHP